jgi:SAM-dependent methyltransferase
VADASLDRLLAEAKALPLDGWDLSRLGDRISVAPLPWDFAEIVARHARVAAELLDLDTGGGEWLASLAQRPSRTVATESWPPNVDVARTRLAANGVTLVQTKPAPDNVDQPQEGAGGKLPFPDRSFALVTSRHGSFVASEVARVLRPNGVFLTQQVGGDYGDFHEALGLARPPAPPRRWDHDLADEQLTHVSLRVVESDAATEVTTFADVGALAWYLRLTPWTIPDFAIEAYRPQLERLHLRIAREGPLRVSLPAFWLRARKPS